MKTEMNKQPSNDVESMALVLHLVLTYHWFDEIESGRKRKEYREMSPHWKRLIWDRRDKITHVRFARGYTSKTMTFPVEKIMKERCPYDGWDDVYYTLSF